MKGKNTQIIRIERIQNERWYMQYLAHRKEFKKRLGVDTEKRLYHGCPEAPANSIIQDCFNRSFAGVNGTLYLVKFQLHICIDFRYIVWFWGLFFIAGNLQSRPCSAK